jgi:hypothetical protein
MRCVERTGSPKNCVVFDMDFCIVEFGGYSFMKFTRLNILLYEEYSSSYFIHHVYGSIYRATNILIMLLLIDELNCNYN